MEEHRVCFLYVSMVLYSFMCNFYVSRQVYWAGPLLGGAIATLIYVKFVDSIGRVRDSLTVVSEKLVALNLVLCTCLLRHCKAH